jgi:hypothetical protein
MRDKMPGCNRRSARSGSSAVVVLQHAAQALAPLCGAGLSRAASIRLEWSGWWCQFIYCCRFQVSQPRQVRIKGRFEAGTRWLTHGMKLAPQKFSIFILYLSLTWGATSQWPRGTPTNRSQFGCVPKPLHQRGARHGGNRSTCRHRMRVPKGNGSGTTYMPSTLVLETSSNDPTETLHLKVCVRAGV